MILKRSQRMSQHQQQQQQAMQFPLQVNHVWIMRKDQDRSKRTRTSKSHILKGILATVLFMTLYIHNRNSHQTITQRTNVLEPHKRVMKSSNERESGGSMQMNISRKEVMSALKKMHNGNFINKGYFKHLLTESKKMLHSLDNVYDVVFPVSVSGETNSKFDEESGSASGGKITIVGDIHGQFTTMLHIFQANGFPSRNHVYIFNGDYVDRGQSSLQALTMLILFKLHCPECIHFTRGNHETQHYLPGQVRTNVLAQYDEEIYDLLVEVINEIPVAVIVDHELLIMHAGIHSPNITIDDIKAIPKGIDSTMNELLDELLWAEPSSEEGTSVQEERGAAFGPDVSKAFLDHNNLNRMIRGHTDVENGYANDHDGRVVTIWSAPDYGSGSYANLDSDLEIYVTHFDAYPELVEIDDWSIL